MDETTHIIRDYYDANVTGEWERIGSRPEFFLTVRMLNRYIRPGQRVLDIGGGPGRYSLYLAGNGCDVTLLDLSPGNVAHARQRAAEDGLLLTYITGDAREADRLADGQFDHVLLMGPLYHLLEESDRVRAVEAALRLLEPGGLLFASFINSFGGMIYAMRNDQKLIVSDVPDEVTYRKDIIARRTFAGDAFTKAVFIEPSEITPFMERFPLEKLHLFGQEGVLSPCEDRIMSQSPQVIKGWLDFSEQIWEREEFLVLSEHLMYVGRKYDG